MRLLLALTLLLAGTLHASEDDSLGLIIKAVSASDNPQVQLIMLRGMLSGLQGRRDVPAPPGWQKLAASLKEDAESAKVVDELAQIFGDEGAAEAGLAVLADKSAESAARRDALKALLTARNADVLPMLQPLLDGPLALDAIRAYGVMPYQEAPRILLGRYAKLDANAKRTVVETLASRPGYAQGLLGALAKGTVAKADIPAYVARSLENLLGKAFTEVYGDVRKVADDKSALMATYKAKVASPAFAKADAHRGRAVYQKVCAACHKMYDEGGIIGPDLTGSNRADLDYLLLNVLDPNFDVPEGYRLVNVTTKDGRILTGTVAEENDKTLVLSMVGQKTTVAKTDIEERQVSPVSMMPEGLLGTLNDGEFLDLISYLRTDEQVEVAK
jgi:putative heme-binding domain-containing protein